MCYVKIAFEILLLQQWQSRSQEFRSQTDGTSVLALVVAQYSRGKTFVGVEHMVAVQLEDAHLPSLGKFIQLIDNNGKEESFYNNQSAWQCSFL